MSEVRELRLRYTLDGVEALVTHIDHMKLGELPEPVALLLVYASNAANWHPVEEADA